jgi:hypothetical protein
MEVSSQLHAPAALFPEKISCCHRLVGCVYLRAAMDMLEKGKCLYVGHPVVIFKRQWRNRKQSTRLCSILIYIIYCNMFRLFNKNPHSGTLKYLKNDYHTQHHKMFRFLGGGGVGGWEEDEICCNITYSKLIQNMAVVAFIPPFSNRKSLAFTGTSYDSSIIQPVTYSFYRLSYSGRSKREDREQFKLFSRH